MWSLASIASLMNRPPVWCVLEIILVALDAGREAGSDFGASSREPARCRARRACLSSISSRLLDFRPHGAFGMLGEELAGALDLVGE